MDEIAECALTAATKKKENDPEVSTSRVSCPSRQNETAATDRLPDDDLTVYQITKSSHLLLFARGEPSG